MLLRHPGLRLTYKTTEITTEQFTEWNTTTNSSHTTKEVNSRASVQHIYTKFTEKVGNTCTSNALPLSLAGNS